MARPANAPTSVPAFHRTKTDAPVAQYATRASGSVGWAMAIAVLSSSRICAAASRRRPRTLSMGASRSPYRPFRNPSIAAVAAPANGFPPAPTTPIRANCDAPVNMSTDRADVCRMDRPAATDRAPNDTAYAPDARPIPTALRITDDRARSRDGGGVPGGVAITAMYEGPAGSRPGGAAERRSGSGRSGRGAGA